MDRRAEGQRRQSGLKSGGSWIRVKNFSIFPGNFSKDFRFFSGKFSKNFDFFRQFHLRISIFPGKFPKKFDFLGNF